MGDEQQLEEVASGDGSGKVIISETHSHRRYIHALTLQTEKDLSGEENRGCLDDYQIFFLLEARYNMQKKWLEFAKYQHSLGSFLHIACD